MAQEAAFVASCVLVFCSVVMSQTSIEQAFIDNEIVPDVIDKAPTQEITVVGNPLRIQVINEVVTIYILFVIDLVCKWSEGKCG